MSDGSMCKVTDSAKQSLKALAKRLIEMAGGQTSAALACRAAPQSLSLYAKRDAAQFMPSDVIADLEADVGEPLVTRELARIAGFGLCPLDGIGGTMPTDPVHLVMHMTQELGRFAKAVHDMDSDGIREPVEIDVCIARALDLQTQVSESIEELHRYRSRMGARVKVQS